MRDRPGVSREAVMLGVLSRITHSYDGLPRSPLWEPVLSHGHMMLCCMDERVSTGLGAGTEVC